MPLLHLWSLSVEEQFYLAFPLLMWLAFRTRINPGLLTLILWASSLALCLHLSLNEQYAVQAFYMPYTRVWEILSGSLIAYVQVRHSNSIERVPTAVQAAFKLLAPIAGIVLIAYAALSFTKGMPFPSWRALLPTGGAILLIAAGSQALFNRQVMALRPLVWVGLISYPLYLWHWPLLSYARILESGTPPVLFRIAALEISVVLAWVTYKVIEHPIRIVRRASWQPVVLAGTLACITAVGVYTEMRGGLDFRAAASDAGNNRFDYPYKKTCAPLTGTDFGEDWCNADTMRDAAPSVIMVGDSFANAFSTIVRSYNAAHALPASGFAQIGRGECPMLIGYGPAYCQEFTTAATKYITKSDAVNTVILAANWPAYYSEKDYHGLRPKQTHQEFMDAFKATVEYYQRAGKKVAVFLATPQDTNPRSCITRKVELQEHLDINNCTYPIAKARLGDNTYRSLILPYVASKGVKVFDPFEFMCNTSECRVSVDRKILYTDSGHISVYGAEYLATQGQGALNAILSPQALAQAQPSSSGE